MNVVKTTIEGLIIIEPKIHKDERGYFFESYNQKIFEQHNIHCSFVQDNQSLSSYGVLRGLHFQTGQYAHPQPFGRPHPQASFSSPRSPSRR